MKAFLKVIFCAASALYPVIVFTLLVVFKLPARVFSLCAMAIAIAFFLAATGARGKGHERAKSFDARPLASSALLLTAALFCFFTNKAVFLKMYSVAVSATFLAAFASTLARPPTMIFRLATLQDKTIEGSLKESRVRAYCRKVTIAWCVFFVCNGLAAAFTTFFCSDKIWSIYNGGISYVLLGLMFAVEFTIRKQVDKKMPHAHPITKFSADSWDDSHVVCFEGKWSDGRRKTWRDFLADTAKIRSVIDSREESAWILHCEDYWLFACAFVALLQRGKTVALTQNVTKEFIAEMKKPGMNFMSDKKIDGALFIPDAIESAAEPSESDIRSAPKIESDKTEILMFTSGSMGKPKAVRQRMTEFEADNAFVMSKWGDEFLRRKLVTTVSQHHIYGFLFGFSLPFALGVPFRRFRVEFPEEFETLDDEPYMIIAVPAFLKRAVESLGDLNLKDPFIFTSGGAVPPDVAARTEKIFGFWPLEVYGSTETSGIAWRQSKAGPEWTPFANAKIWKGADGCLVIVSPYIKDPAGFATADMVDMTDDGRFLLKGRCDSIVKIEEKRVSLTEVESRILQTGLASDAKVIALEDSRQYLAAVVALNDEGARKFSGAQKLEMNKFFREFLARFFEGVVIPKRWRYVDSIPCDTQGKKRKEDIAALFDKKD